MKTIYVLKLEDNKYFIHHEIDSDKDFEKIMIECEIYYDYLKKYKPISIIETIFFTDNLDIDKTVKQYMYLYGFNNVRGGSYLEEKIPDYSEKTLNTELEFIDNNEKECLNILEEILNNYEYKNYKTVEEIHNEMDGIKKEFIKYKDEKEKFEKLNFFLVNNNKYNMQNFIPEDMEWLYEICLLNSNKNIKNYNKEINNILNSNYVKKYKKILIYLKRLYNIFEENDLFSKHNIDKTIYLKHPFFLFDGFLFNTHNKNLEELSKTCKTFQHMGNIIFNKIKENEFDIMSYGYGYEWKTSRIIFILEKKIKLYNR
jgi:hypothetical protein